MKEEKKIKLDFIRKMGKSNTYRQNAGITLIALVVTIIILLILAGVTVSLVVGQNGLLQRAQSASNTMANATANELTQMGKYANEVDELTEGFISGGGSGGSGSGSGSGGSAAALKVGTTDLSTVSDLSTMYGETVDYISTSHPSITWQLFYADSSNYYIIASDYVPTSELPCSSDSTGTDLQAVNGIADDQYVARFASSYDYNDYVMANSAYSAGGDSTAVVNNGLTSTYLKWVEYATTNSYAKNNVNMKAVAYMMDTNKWSSFADGASGAKAMGGPTLEMLSLSWNAVSGHTAMTSYATLSDSNANNNGYKANSPETNSNFFGTNTNMWFIKELGKADGYWLAAPSSSNNSTVRNVYYSGRVSASNAYSNYYGFRPLVSIPRS